MSCTKLSLFKESWTQVETLTETLKRTIKLFLPGKLPQNEILILVSPTVPHREFTHSAPLCNERKSSTRLQDEFKHPQNLSQGRGHPRNTSPETITNSIVHRDNASRQRRVRARVRAGPIVTHCGSLIVLMFTFWEPK